MENIPYIQSLHLSILSLLGLNITSHLNRVESPNSTSTITTNTAESRTTTITIPIIGTVLAFVGVVVAIVGVGFAYIQVYRPRNRAAPVDHEALMHLNVEYHSLRDMEAEAEREARRSSTDISQLVPHDIVYNIAELNMRG